MFDWGGRGPRGPPPLNTPITRRCTEDRHRPTQLTSFFYSHQHSIIFACIQWRRNEFGSRAHVRRKAPEKFVALQIQLVVLMSVLVMVSTVWSVSCFLFFYSRCLTCPAICKSGHVPPCPMESVPVPVYSVQ